MKKITTITTDNLHGGYYEPKPINECIKSNNNNNLTTSDVSLKANTILNDKMNDFIMPLNKISENLHEQTRTSLSFILNENSFKKNQSYCKILFEEVGNNSIENYKLNITDQPSGHFIAHHMDYLETDYKIEN